AGRPAVVPNDENIGRASAVDKIGQPQAVRAARNVVHAVANLVALAEAHACRVRVDAVRAFEDLLSLLDVWPEQPARVIVTPRLGGRGGGLVVIGCPPYLL